MSEARYETVEEMLEALQTADDEVFFSAGAIFLHEDVQVYCASANDQGDYFYGQFVISETGESERYTVYVASHDGNLMPASDFADVALEYLA